MKKTGLSKNVVSSEDLPSTESSSLATGVRLNSDLDVTKLEPNDWGSKMLDCCYVPILSDMDPVPESLLRIIHCYCKTERTTNMMKNNQ